MSHFKRIDSQIQFSQEKMQKVNLFETERFFCDLYCLEPGQQQKLHSHDREDKIYLVKEGSGTIRIGDQTREVSENDICLAPAGLAHGVENSSEGRMVLLVFMTPNPNYQRNSS